MVEQKKLRKTSGIFLIVLSLTIYYLRPLQNCDWWNIFCSVGSLLFTPIFIIISIILLMLGVWKLLT